MTRTRSRAVTDNVSLGLREIELAVWDAAGKRDLALRHESARRRAHGIVHTPPALARGVVKLADELLRERFALPAGVCDARALVIDPACGPGAFLAAVLAQAESSRDCQPQLIGFDVDQSALDLAAELRVHPAASRLELRRADMFDATAVLAAVTPSDQVAVLLGNPPWTSARSQHAPAVQHLLEDFRRDQHGERLAERKLGVLSDAYVRFFRVCAEAARQARAGALIGLVTNASFLDGPVHRGMRAALLQWFDELFVLDLGGSALLARHPGTRDDNVFGVRPSVAITWLCRYPAPRAPATRQLHYARLHGDKSSKLARVAQAALAQFPWRVLRPEPPLLRFVPTRKLRSTYAAYWSLADCMPFHREGVQSNRDAVVIDPNRERLLARLRAFVHEPKSELALSQRALSHYDPRVARARVAAVLEQDPDGSKGLSVALIAYRPFDERYFCPVAPLCHRPRPDLLAAQSRSALALVSVRKDRGTAAWTHAAASTLPIDNCFLSARSSCRARAFPNCTPEGGDNLSEATRATLSECVGSAVVAQDFQHYALACLCASSYRALWEQELHQDYPRIPVPRAAAAFRQLAALGARLAQLFVEPLALVAAASNPVVELARHVRVADLVLDPERSAIMLHGEPLVTVSAAALELCVGHHRPLSAFIASRRHLPLDAQIVLALQLRAARLEHIVALLSELDRVFVHHHGVA